MNCQHDKIVCLNEYELIRKYQCLACAEVMVCACDEAYGLRFLPHQLDEGVEFTTQEPVPVTIGFQPSICCECRGLPAEPHPMAAIYGRTSKIKRYYWRELFRRETELFAEWLASAGIDADPFLATGAEAEHARKDAAKRALEEIKHLHQTNPKYQFVAEESHADVVSKCQVDVVRLEGVYIRDHTVRRAQILCGGALVSPEDFASRHFRELGYEILFVESVPFHVLFSVFMWLVIQDPSDERVRIVGFGDRTACDDGNQGKEVLCHLPDDFGSQGYGQRRKKAIDRHFSEMLESDEWDWLFDYWLYHSKKLRHYLWAHREKDVETAKKLFDILPKSMLLKILRYLVESYWERFLGWPDLLVFRDDELFFVEVKSSKDRLSDAQKRWIRDNHTHLKIPFRLAKIHKVGVVDANAV